MFPIAFLARRGAQWSAINLTQRTEIRKYTRQTGFAGQYCKMSDV